MDIGLIIENKYNDFFRTNDYLLISEIISSTINTKNADYISKDFRYIVELKVLQKNHFTKGGIIEKMRAIVLPDKEIYNTGGITYINIPNANREGQIDNFEEPIRRIIKKANRQIRETKDLFKKDSAGIILFVQTVETISPELYVEMILMLLNNEFTSIDGFIFMTSFTPIKDINTNRFHPYCFLRFPNNVKENVVKEMHRLGLLLYNYFSIVSN